MASIKKRKVGKKSYYYLEHSFKVNGKVKVLSKYLGNKVPASLEGLKKNIEFEALRKVLTGKLLAIKRKHSKEPRSYPSAEKEKIVEDFIVHFIYDSSKIEGSSLTYNDTAGLFLHGISPKNKPVRDIQEAEGYRKAFYAMAGYKGELTLKNIEEWHKMIFEASVPYIAGKIRIHKIIVTGSRVSFPHPEQLPALLKEFFLWYNQNKHKYNPVEFSALAHLKFVTIHPFSDGNGRISRLLTNYVLMRAGYPFFNVKFGDRMAYYRNLETSQLWNKDKHFVRFFIKKYINANKRYLS